MTVREDLGAVIVVSTSRCCRNNPNKIGIANFSINERILDMQMAEGGDLALIYVDYFRE